MLYIDIAVVSRIAIEFGGNFVAEVFGFFLAVVTSTSWKCTGDDDDAEIASSLAGIATRLALGIAK